MTEPETKPCPFCGEMPSKFDKYLYCDNDEDDLCWNDGNRFSIEAWNTRPIEERLSAVIAALLPYVSPDMPPDWLRVLLDTGDVDQAWEIKQRDDE